MGILKKIFTDTIYLVAFRETLNDDLLFLVDKNKFELISAPKFSWYADPMLFEYNRKLWLFVERMDQWNHKGVISAAMYDNGRFSRFIDVLEEPFHLSYPMIFEKDGVIYMIPETGDTNSIRLYRCSEFPDKWIYEGILAEGYKFVDTNIIHIKDEWFLITGVMDKKMGASTRMIIYSANNIENLNITQISELSGSCEFSFDKRGGGQIFQWRNKYLRPAQCGDESTYGKNVKIYDFSISKSSFNEECISVIDKTKISLDKNICITGTHTYGYKNGLEVVDLKVCVLANPVLQIRKILRKLRCLLNDLFK